MFRRKPKRIIKLLPVEEKLQIIKRINRGDKMGDLAIEYGIGRTTIHDIYKNRAKIQEYSEAQMYRLTKRNSLRTGHFPRVEEALYEWYLQEKKTGNPLSAVILIERGRELYKEIYNKNDFPTSTGWFTGFKRRYGVRLTQKEDHPAEKKTEEEPTPIGEFKDKFFRKIIDLELSPSQVYIVTQTDLCWRIQANKGLGENLKKERITFLSCANASGLHKLKLLVIGNTHKSRELGNSNLPVHYFRQNIACVTEESFRTWFYDCFIAETRNWLTEHNLPPKFLLVVDEYLCNADEEAYTTEDQLATALFYPSECKEFMPLGQNVLQTVKQSYKRHILLTASSKDSPVEDCLKKLNMKDMVFTLAQSWRSLNAFTIAISWRTVWENMILDMNQFEDNVNDKNDLELLRNIAGDMLIPVEELQGWFEGVDDQREKNINEIILSNPEEEKSPANTTAAPIVSQKDAVESFDKCIQWADQNGSSCEEITLLRKLRDEALISKRNASASDYIHFRT